MADRLMVLDTPSLYFRAFHGVPTSVRSPSGEPVNAVRGLIDMVARLVTEHRPDRLVCAMDEDWRPEFRVALVPSYKAHRLAPEGGETVPDLLPAQVPVMVEVLRAVGLAVLGAPGYEADDVIGTVTARHDGPVDVVTGDRDLFQLVDDDRGVRVLYTQRGLGRLGYIDDTALLERYGVPGRSYADLALLRGDPSDGLPGVPGIGERTAAELVAAYGSVAALLEAQDSGAARRLAPRVHTALEGARDYLARAGPVVRVALDVPLPAVETALPRLPRDPDRVVALADRWGLDAPLNRLLAALRR